MSCYHVPKCWQCRPTATRNYWARRLGIAARRKVVAKYHLGCNVERLAQEFRARLATWLEATWNEQLVVLRFRLQV